MTDRPIGDDLSDEALFAGLTPALPLPPSEAVVTAAKLGLSVMLAANLRPAFSFDLADAEPLWAVGLAAYSPTSIVGAARHIATNDEAEFPTLAEFATLVASFDRAERRPARHESDPPEKCSECQDEDGLVFKSHPGEGGTADRRPCSQCRPVQFEMWQAGHFRPTVENQTCHCNHPQCPATKHREKMASRA
jgi:hypothetical protein